MRRHRLTRRQFLQTAAASTAVAGAGAATLLGAQPPASADHSHAAHRAAARPAADHTQEGVGLQFFGRRQAATVQALAARIIPTDELGPGAREAGVIHYIDQALAGPYARDQTAYLRGLAALDAYCREQFGTDFVSLAPDQQDQVLADLEAGRASGFTVPSAQEFFTLVWRHTMEGFFCDPMYGGNQDFIGWKLVGFPGPVGFYTPEEMVADRVLDKPFTSMRDWTRPL
jgi:gluconate 2-dehydrogenase gamma chain